MVHITDTAMGYLEAIRDAYELTADEAISLITDPSGSLSFGIIRPEAGDELIARNGQTVVAVPHNLSDALKSITIDYIEDEGEELEGFVLRDEGDGPLPPPLP